MKIMQNILFYLLLGIDILFTIMSFCVEGSLIGILALWCITIILWIITIISFGNQIIEYMSKYNNDDYDEDDEIFDYNYQKKSSEDFEECYKIAVRSKIDKILAEDKK